MSKSRTQNMAGKYAMMCIEELRQNTKLAVSSRTIHAEDRLDKAVEALKEINATEDWTLAHEALKEIE